MLWEEAMPYLAAAARAYGRDVLAAAPAAEPGSPAELGRALLAELFGIGLLGTRLSGTRSAGGALPAVVAAVVARPDDAAALDALGGEVAGELDDPRRQAAVIAVLTRFYQRGIEAGRTEAMIGLGELRRALDDTEGAQAAYQQAAGAGDERAMLRLADLLMAELGDAAGARAWFQRAADSADPDIAAEAMVDLGHLLVIFQRDYPAARAAFQRAIDSAHPEWAPAAAVGLAGLLLKQGDTAGARDAYQQAIESANPDSAGRALVGLGELLEKQGDTDGARACYNRVVESRTESWAAPALTNVLNLLRAADDLDGARAAHRMAVETGNSEAPYALVVIGQLLMARGDRAGAEAAYREAAAAGDWLAGEILADMAAENEPGHPGDWTDEDYAGLPPEFDRRHMQETGLAVLEHGLPPLPATLTYQMTIPIAYWTADRCAVVLFLSFHRDGRHGPQPVATMGEYSRDAGQWVAVPGFWLGTSFSIDPIARPDDERDLDGRPIAGGSGTWSEQSAPGHPAAIAHGRVGPEVTELILVQDGRETRRRLDSHFGGWVVCTEHATPFEVRALDADEAILGSITESFPPH